MPRPKRPASRVPRGGSSERPRGRTDHSAPAAARRREKLGPLADRDRGERLNKVLADAGVASRREADRLIENGHVMVNGRPVTQMPAWVDLASDRVEVDGQVIHGGPSGDGSAAKATYILLHKPKGVITTTRDPEGRPHVLDLVDPAQVRAARLFPVGRLDADSTGLILLTNDGDLAHRLTHPSYEITKAYRVLIRGQVGDEDLERLRRGLVLATRGRGARKAAMDRIKLLGRRRDARHGDRTTLLITLSEGQNREIRRMVARLGFKVLRLERVALGPLKLKGLAAGQWRPLTGVEVGALRKAAGLAREASGKRRGKA